MPTGDYLGLDVGEKRTGIARASVVAKLAEPLKIIETSEAIQEIKNISESNQIQAIIIGLPRNLEGNDTAQTRWVRDWTDQLKKEINLPFYYQDEALTSHLADQRVGDTKPNDDEAASIILQDYLDALPDNNAKVDDK